MKRLGTCYFGVSAPYNSMFTLFGQFFDHGLDLVPKGGSGTVMVPLQPGDPLYVAGSNTNFMTLTRATNLSGPDGVLGTADDVRENVNLTTPYVDQNQTYTSHPSHQVFLREYVLVNDRPMATGLLLDGRDGNVTNGGLPTWADVKRQARELLGIALADTDIGDVPVIATDQYGKFTPSAAGYAQLVMADGTLKSGTPANPVSTAGASRTGHAFLDDIAHSAVPFGRNGQALAPDADSAVGLAAGTGVYDNEMLDAHYITGDGRGNENIGLTAVHHVFHSEHNKIAEQIKQLSGTLPNTSRASLANWQTAGQWNGERLFQAARIVTEMQYQHSVFQEFARRVQPAINAFAGYDPSVDPSIMAEYAHAVYRFGHSMLNETIERKNADGSRNDIGLIEGFLNPPALRDGGTAGVLSPAAGAGAVVQGMVEQRGNEIDEFVTEALRNNLVGLPLDLATLNVARARDTGTPTLNTMRRAIYNKSGNPELQPYDSWFAYGQSLRNPESLVNFVAAYASHPSVTSATTIAEKRAAAELLVSGGNGAPADREEFLFSSGAWTLDGQNRPTTGVEAIDLWIGGLAEGPRLAAGAGLLGSTFDFVFADQLQRLQDGDRMYYLSRLAGTNLLLEIEASSLSQMFMRNSTATNLPGLFFSAPDCAFEVSALNFSGTQATNAPAGCRPITRAADGTVMYNGYGNMTVGGTNGADKLRAGRADDTLWGNDGNDRLEGNYGDDTVDGGTGDDVLTDAGGIDLLNAGDGDDVAVGGPGLDAINGGQGQDALVAGTDGSGILAGTGDDRLRGGNGADALTGGEGHDWIEGGNGADTLTGDNGAAVNTAVRFNDVLIGDGGDDLFAGEGGDDILVGGAGVDNSNGGLGFDWMVYANDPNSLDVDMQLGNVVVPPLGVNVDLFLDVEAVSGQATDDVIRGDDRGVAELIGHELTDLTMISGMSELLPGQASYNSGNILLGGLGSDSIMGRGGDDIIDGDRYVSVRLSAQNANGVEIARANSMSSLVAALISRQITPARIVIVREVVTPTVAEASLGIDTAVYRDVQANYTVTPVAGQINTYRVAHVPAAGALINDGVDIVRNVEQLQFADGTVELAPNRPGAGITIFSPTVPLVNVPITVSPAVTDADGINGSVTYRWQYQMNDANRTWMNTATTGVTFTPALTHIGLPLRVVATYTDGRGIPETVTSPVTSPVVAANIAASGTPTILPATVATGVQLTATTSGITDANGLGAFTYRWQQSATGGAAPFTDIAGATASTFTPGSGQIGRTLRVVVSFIDGIGFTETVTSAATDLVGDNWTGTVGADTWTGSTGADLANGLDGNDTLSGGNGADTIYGGLGIDTLSGGAGDDIVDGGVGNDNLTLGAGNDVVQASDAVFGSDTVTDFDADPAGGQDRIDLRPLGVTSANFAARVRITASGGRVLVTVRDGTTVQGTILLRNVTSTAQVTIQDFILG